MLPSRVRVAGGTPHGSPSFRKGANAKIDLPGHDTILAVKRILGVLIAGWACLAPAAVAQKPTPDPATTTAPPPRPLRYRFVPEKSSITFEVPTTYRVVRGKTNAWQGGAEVEPSTPGALSGQIRIRADSLETGNARRDLDARDRVLEASRFPEIVFQPRTYKGNLSHFEPGATVTAEISGDLTIHGVTQPIQTSVECAILADHVFVAGAVPVFWKRFGVRDMSRWFLRIKEPMLVVFRLWAVPE